MMRTAATCVATALLALAMLGCGPLDYLFEKTFSMFTPPPKTKPRFSLGGKSVAVVVDAADQQLLSVNPQLGYKVAKALAQELSDRRAAGSIVSPRDVVTYAQSDPDFGRKSLVEIGSDLGVDLVLQVVIESYTLETATAGDSYNGYAGIGLRVVDVAAGGQVWPGMEQLHLLEVRSVAGIVAESRAEAENVLLEGLALKVGQVFVAYEVEKLPPGRQVK